MIWKAACFCHETATPFLRRVHKDNFKHAYLFPIFPLCISWGLGRLRRATGLFDQMSGPLCKCLKLTKPLADLFP